MIDAGGSSLFWVVPPLGKWGVGRRASFQVALLCVASVSSLVLALTFLQEGLQTERNLFFLELLWSCCFLTAIEMQTSTKRQHVEDD